MKAPVRSQRNRVISSTVFFIALGSAPVIGRSAERPSFKPGYNFYSPKEDAELGRESSAQVNNQLALLDDAGALKYVNDLGKRLVAFAPNNHSEYVWEFRVVNSAEINAFALPGGYIYVNRGVIEASENEAQLAGVLAHESGHVVMRHGTHIASQAVLAQGGMALLTSILGQSGGLTNQLAQLGLGLGVDSLMLRNSREAETQADQVGTYILFQAGYDPRAMVQFFQIVAERYPQRTLQFFSDHPNPENRIKDVDVEIADLGPVHARKNDSLEFKNVKQHLAMLAPPPSRTNAPGMESRPQPPLPSETMLHFSGRVFALDYPDNWQAQDVDDTLELYPQGGIVTISGGDNAQAYGAAISVYTPEEKNWGLVEATERIVDSMRQSNPRLHVSQQTGISLRGKPAISILLQNDSPLDGQEETDRFITVRQGDSVLTFIFIAPTSVFESYAPTFGRILQSVELAR
jgi:Zn-dependent protease with chaperone function